MDKIRKFFRKLSAKHQTLLRAIIGALIAGDTQGLNVVKLSGSDFYRLRKGPFRIIFHYDKGEPIIDSVRLRNEATYRDL